ncbi:MAG: GNAT family N-acetyltransferase [Bacteroidia bacterium]
MNVETLPLKITIHKLNLETPRLRIRKLIMNDVTAWMEYFQSPQVLKFMGFKPDDKQGCIIWIEKQLKRYAANEHDGLRALIDKETNEMVGQCGFLIQEIDNEVVLEIGYHLISRFWKKGYATEAAKAFKEYAFENNLADSLVSIIHIDNINSQQVAERNGMKRERQTTFRDTAVFIYRIDKQDWLKSF